MAKKISTFKERFTELIESSPKNRTAIAQEFGVAKQTISAWITGQSSPRAPVVSALADYFHVSVPWLMGFDVPRSDSPALNLQMFGKDPAEHQLIDVYRSLPDPGKHYLLQQAHAAVLLYGDKDTQP